ncbi:diguanylate cyclase [Saccharibacillus sp. JS10]|uniref:GGDEF domain-containing protein n=1 Tax=Saccharibacillus sp. JS10 TaxID=2950552 RepID=UPI00210D9A80|nr:GGDEF domain-containing protein [Saccharibacillus sp. JS10]MCQ4088626.1 GGDEF domain-containing protein [Saccharibacillus sp. JS10]
MNLHLDPQTIYVSLICGHVLTILLLSAYRRSEIRDASISFFFTAKLIQAVAWSLMVLKGNFNDLVVLSLSNTLLFIGIAFEAAALLKLQDVLTLRMQKIGIAMTILAIVCFNSILFGHNDEMIRIAVASFFAALFITPPALRLLYQKKSSTLRKVMGSVYTLLAIALLIRTFGALSIDTFNGLLASRVTHDLFSICAYMTMILTNTGFVLLAKQKSDEDLFRLASLDDLTQIWNRRTFVLKSEIMLDQHAKRQLPVSFLLFDIDGFKGINDQYGHDIGDRVLREMSVIVSQQLGTNDLFGRYGGDEFAIILPGYSIPESTLLAERIRVAVEGTYTLSIGALTFVPQHRSQLDRVYKSCDLALYDAKREGRNTIRRAERYFEKPLTEEIDYVRI